MSLVTPKLYPIVDLDGLDLAEVEGQQVPGIYNKISDNLNEDKIEIFYHWYFADIMLSPHRVFIDDSVTNQYTINNAILVKSDDTVSIIGHTYIPVIESLSVDENGTYEVPSGVDGYNPVVVDVPSNPPVLVQLNVTENGTYTPATGVDGFSQVEVNVPSVAPVLIPLSVNENGIFTPQSGVDGFNSVTVALDNPYINPAYSGLSYGYVSTKYFIGYNSKTSCISFYELEAGTYVTMVGNPRGNRLRIAIFEGLSYEDFSYYVENPSEGTIYTGTGVIDTSTAATILQRLFFTISTPATVAIMTSANSEVIQTYLFKITN